VEKPVTPQQQQKARYPYGDMRNVQRSDRRPGDWYYDAAGKLQHVLERVN